MADSLPTSPETVRLRAALEEAARVFGLITETTNEASSVEDRSARTQAWMMAALGRKFIKDALARLQKEAPDHDEARTIVLIIKGPNNIDVHEGDRYSDRLMWDEALGQIASMTHPKINEPRYPMKTEAEWQAYSDRMRRARVSTPCHCCGLESEVGTEPPLCPAHEREAAQMWLDANPGASVFDCDAETKNIYRNQLITREIPW